MLAAPGACVVLRAAPSPGTQQCLPQSGATQARDMARDRALHQQPASKNTQRAEREQLTANGCLEAGLYYPGYYSRQIPTSGSAPHKVWCWPFSNPGLLHLWRMSELGAPRGGKGGRRVTPALPASGNESSCPPHCTPELGGAPDAEGQVGISLP